MKRIVVFKNGTDVDGKVLLVTHSLDELLAAAGSKFNITAKRLFTQKGGEIDDIKLIRDDDILYVSSGEGFLPRPSASGESLAAVRSDPTAPLSQTDSPAVKPPVTTESPVTTPPPLAPPASKSKAKSSAAHWVTLNVGGKYFTTSRSTLLTKEPNSMLARMFAEGENGYLMTPSNVDARGAYLIDRSPTYFEPILNYLRNGQLIFDSNVNLEGILEEARFFGIESVIPQLESLIAQSQQTRDNLPLSRRDVINALIMTPFISELRFQGVNLAGSDLSRLDLRYINFKPPCQPILVSFLGQEVIYDKLHCAGRCYWADLENSYDYVSLGKRGINRNHELRFQGVNLAGADLSRLDLRHINFKYACLHGCRMTGANLSWCSLERADLSHAVLEGAQLLGVKMVCANLEGANLRACNFEDPAGARANMEGVNLKGAILEGSNMAGVNLRVATLKGANLKNCDLRAAVLAGADLQNCDLSGSDLQEANLRGANLKDAAFELMLTPLHMSQTVR